MREFIDTQLPALKAQFPHLEVDVKVSASRSTSIPLPAHISYAHPMHGGGSKAHATLPHCRSFGRVRLCCCFPPAVAERVSQARPSRPTT